MLLSSSKAYLLACLMACWSLSARADEKRIVDFVNQYCVDCHHDDDPSGQRTFSDFDPRKPHLDTLIALQEMVDQLALQDMPPPDAEQPAAGERAELIDDLSAQMVQLQSQLDSTGGQTVLRRLTRREYLATVRDLLALDLRMVDPTIAFPAERKVQHLDNVGDTLVTSGYLLDQYLDAADQLVEKALAATEPPQEQSWQFRGHFRQQPELDGAHRKAFDFQYMCLYDAPLADKPEGAYGAIHDFEHGVPHDGVYEIRVQAQALHRDTPYKESDLQIDLSQPFRMGIRPGKLELGSLHNLQSLQPLLAEVEVADDQLQWYTFRVHLDQGFTPRFTFENGLNAIRGLHGRLHRIYNKTLPESVRAGKGIVANRNAMLKHGKVPQIRIHEITIKGPLVEDWPTASVAAIIPSGEFRADDAGQLIRQFASKAYRRPITDREYETLGRVYQRRAKTGHSTFQAFKDTVKAVLCSPSFLYLDPDCDSESEQISQHALAARLAYFLTGSMPDSELRSLADQGRLDDKALLQQTRRLLASERSDAMITGFTDAWLGLSELGGMPPDRGSFWMYYASSLEADMRAETHAFMRHLIADNVPVDRCLSADYSFINRDLARLYRVQEQFGTQSPAELRRFQFSDGRRGGLLGQASVLTVSANGIETSPVVRGVWMLENILGTPAPSPPDDVPAIDPDVRGAKSVRDLLQKHRASEACAGCHRKIDPLGFAMECFDPIGAMRSSYGRNVNVDPSGQLPNGSEFADLKELKQLLLQRKGFFVRAFTSKMMAYALGRRMEPTDRIEIDALLKPLESEDYPTRQVIEAIVVSPMFKQR